MTRKGGIYLNDKNRKIAIIIAAILGCVGLFYLGMQLTSLTNPGLFCPLPNAALTVLVFTVLEKCVDGPAAALHRRK